jgi:hypothetical protein
MRGAPKFNFNSNLNLNKASPTFRGEAARRAGAGAEAVDVAGEGPRHGFGHAGCGTVSTAAAHCPPRHCPPRRCPPRR